MKVHYKQRNVVDVIDDHISEAIASGRRVDYVELQEEEMDEFKFLAKGFTEIKIPFSDSGYYVYKGIRVYDAR